MKIIIVACGGGIASSATVASKINNRLSDMRLSSKAKAEAVDIKSLDTFIKSADLYVSITPVVRNAPTYEIPTVNGIPFLTGIGIEDAMTEVVKALDLKK